MPKNRLVNQHKKVSCWLMFFNNAETIFEQKSGVIFKSKIPRRLTTQRLSGVVSVKLQPRIDVIGLPCKNESLC